MRSLSMFLVVATAIMACLAVPVTATTITVSSGTIGTVGNSIDVAITADSFPAGLSGYNFTVSLTDPTKAEITGVTFPSWASIHEYGTVPADTVMIRASDLLDEVKPGATGVVLATLQVRGDAVGTTNVALVSNLLQSDDINPKNVTIVPSIVQGTITIGTPPTTSPTTTVPTTTVTTTVPTTTVTTTVPTTTVTTTVPTTTVTTTVPTTTVTTTVPTTTVTTVVPTTQPAGDPGYITVFTFPLHASVSVDGQSLGSSPLMDYQIPSGVHTISISVAGYSGYSLTFTLLPGEHLRFPLIILQRGIPGPTQTTPAPTVTITQTPIPGQTGALSVKSFPRGASIYLNGQFKAVTPAVIEGLSPGDYELKLIKTGYQTKVRTVTVRAGQTTPVPIILLTRSLPVG